MEPAAPPARVLVVEDDPVSRRAAVRLLQKAGHVALEAEDGNTGCLVAFSSKPDCILLDLGLPDVDGLAVLRRLRGGRWRCYVWPAEPSAASAGGASAVAL